MTTPATTFSFRKIMGRPGAYGDMYRDVTRPGSSNQRFHYMGKRGERTSITGIRFFNTKADALTGIDAAEAAQGREVYLYDQLDNMTYRVFLHAARAGVPRAVVSTNSNDNWKVVFTFEVTRTA